MIVIIDSDDNIRTDGVGKKLMEILRHLRRRSNAMDTALYSY